MGAPEDLSDDDGGGIPPSATPLPAEDRAALFDALRGPDGTIPRPLEVAVAFVEVVDGDPHVSRLSLDDIVTPETQGQWDLEQAQSALADVGFASQVSYLSDEWAKVILVRGVQRAYRIPADGNVEVPAYALYLRKIGGDEDWRVHRLATPDLTVEDLTA